MGELVSLRKIEENLKALFVIEEEKEREEKVEEETKEKEKGKEKEKEEKEEKEEIEETLELLSLLLGEHRTHGQPLLDFFYPGVDRDSNRDRYRDGDSDEDSDRESDSDRNKGIDTNLYLSPSEEGAKYRTA